MIEFLANTNSEQCFVNDAIFHLKEGGTITIDREKTEYTSENGKLHMIWKNVYLWAVNEWNILDGYNLAYCSASGLVNLLEDAWVELEIDDDAEESMPYGIEYVVSDVEWVLWDDDMKWKLEGTDVPESSTIFTGY